MQHTIQEWFDAELKQMIGLDVYKMTFPREKGYCIYENQLARVLVYRFENLESLERMLEEFLGLKVPAILNENLSSTKEYASQYEAVRREIRLPDAFLEQQVQHQTGHTFLFQRRTKSIRGALAG